MFSRCCIAVTVSESVSPTLIIRPGKVSGATLPKGVLTVVFEDQRMIARMLDNEIKWDSTLHNTLDKLAKLAEEAIQEHQSGQPHGILCFCHEYL